MGQRLAKAGFLKVVTEEGMRLFPQLGFTQTEPAVFWRKRGEVEHGFFLRPSPSFTRITVDVGADLPSLRQRLDYVAFGGAYYATLLVSRPLGLLCRDGEGERTSYHFATAEEMRLKLSVVYADFVEQAEPWLAGLTTVDAVAKEFYKWRVGPPPGQETSPANSNASSVYGRVVGFLKGHAAAVRTPEGRPPDPFAWAMYGWLLQEAGQSDDARSWLARAYEFLQLPEEMKAGRLVPRVGWKAKPTPPLAEESRLLHLLKMELAR